MKTAKAAALFAASGYGAGFRAEVERRFAAIPLSKAVIACRAETVAQLGSLREVGSAERRARLGWLNGRCAACGGCVLGT